MAKRLPSTCCLLTLCGETFASQISENNNNNNDNNSSNNNSKDNNNNINNDNDNGNNSNINNDIPKKWWCRSQQSVFSLLNSVQTSSDLFIQRWKVQQTNLIYSKNSYRTSCLRSSCISIPLKAAISVRQWSCMRESAVTNSSLLCYQFCRPYASSSPQLIDILQEILELYDDVEKRNTLG